jgi:hypothetical protein
MARKKGNNHKPFWACGGDTELGCGQECWGPGVPQSLSIKLPGKWKQNIVFHYKCATLAKEKLSG